MRMKGRFILDTPVFRWLGKLSWLLWFGCLWLLCSLPVVTLGASTAALYRLAFDLRQEKNYTTKDFFRAFGVNFKKATCIWLVLLGVALVLAAAYYGLVLVEAELLRGVLLAVFCLGFLLWAFVMVYGFALTSYFENTVSATLKNALAMAMGHLRQTISCLAIVMLPLLGVMLLGELMLFILPVLLLAVPAVDAYAITRILEPVFNLYVLKPEES